MLPIVSRVVFEIEVTVACMVLKVACIHDKAPNRGMKKTETQKLLNGSRGGEGWAGSDKS